MIEATVTFGVVIFVGIVAIFAAMPRGLRLWLLKHHLFSSLLVTALTLWIHWGTMTGLMSATLCGLLTSMACFLGRWYWRLA